MLHAIRVWWAQSFQQQTYLGYLAVVRILVGYHFFEASWLKLTGGFLSGENLPQQLATTVVDDPIPLHRAFIETVVIPNSMFFSYLVPLGEMAIALSLLSGCLVRIASSFGAFHNLNIFLAIAIPNGGVQMRLNRIFIFLHLIFVFASAGRSIGIDGWLKKKFPRSWLF
ncbi:MAG: DoxX family protein [Acidobacteria bacterium]|nr:DoxX family protein [Acidobacteriota bacterium]